jgi:hypothetical protein
LYYTNARARGSVSVDVGSALTYNSTTGRFSLPAADGGVSGYVTTTDYNYWDSKQDSLGTGTTAQYLRGDLTWSTPPAPALDDLTDVIITTPSNGQLLRYQAGNWINFTPTYISLTALSATAPLSYNSGTGVFSITQATTSTNGYLSSTDWNTFNNKQSALTNPVTGTGTINYFPKFSSTGSIITDSFMKEFGGYMLQIAANANNTAGISINNSSTGTTAQSFLSLNSNGSGYLNVGKINTTFSVPAWLSTSDGYIYNSGLGNMVIYNDYGGFEVKTGGVTTTAFSISSTGTTYSKGNIGVNNLSPLSPLSFANTTGNKIDFYNDNAGNRYSVQINSNELRLYTTSINDVISLYSNNVIGLVNKNGNTGFGTANPSNIIHAYSSLPRIIADTTSRYAVFNMYVNGSEKGAVYWDNTDDLLRIQANNVSINYGGSASNYGIYAKSNGRIGIGTIIPSSKVEVRYDGDNGSSGFAAYNILATTDSTSNSYQATIAAMHQGAGYANLNLGSKDVGGLNIFWHISKRLAGDSHRLEFYYYNGSGFSSKFIFGTDGNLTAAGGFFEASDKRLKKEISDNPVIDGILNVKPKLYIKNDKQEFGYYAQDIEKILPSAVSQGSDGYMSLSYTQVHTAKISQLEAELAELKEIVKNIIK